MLLSEEVVCGSVAEGGRCCCCVVVIVIVVPFCCCCRITRASSSGVILVISDKVLPFSGEEIRERAAGERRGEEVAGLELVSSDSVV